jgi:nickel/cobalt exporter
MPLNSAAGRRLVLHLAIAVAAIAGVLLVAGALDAALAQGPFGVGAPRPQSAPAQPTGVVGWILLKQAEFYKQFSGLIRAAKTDGSAAWSLFGLSFLYGVFHAAGPGHGKAVISSYMIANDETWRRGVLLSFASAFLQALVAVVFVGIAAMLLNATAATMKTAVDWIEIVSYALIMLIGARLVWVKGRAMIAEARRVHSPKTVGAAVTPVALRDGHHDHGHRHAPATHTHAGAHDHHHGHQHHGHAHDHHGHAHDHHAHDHASCGHAACGHDHGSHSHGGHAHHHHDHCDDASAWGHAHAPEPEELAGPGGWKRGLSAVVAVGLRPCSGAILVLVFALAQGLFWAGVVSTFLMGLGTAITVAVIATIAVSAKAWAGKFANARSGYGMLAMRGIEVCAALVIVAFGALLLSGYLASERMF